MNGASKDILFEPGQRERTVVVQILDDGYYEGTEFIDLHLFTEGNVPKTFSIPLNDNEAKPRKSSSGFFDSIVTTQPFEEAADWLTKAGNTLQQSVIDPFVQATSGVVSTSVLGDAWQTFKKTSWSDFSGGETTICVNPLEFDVFSFSVSPTPCITDEQIRILVDELTTTITDPSTLHGYVDGAVVFVDENFNEVQDFYDTNNNGIRDVGERVETDFNTRYDGSSSVELTVGMDRNRNGSYDDDELQLVSIGGTDVSTGYTIDVPLTAPASYSIISPLTTLVGKLRAINGGNVPAAEVRLAEALNLPGPEYIDANLIQIANADDLLAASAFATSTQVYSTAHQVSSFISGLANAPSVRLLGSLAMADMAHKVAAGGALLDLSEPFVIESIIRGTMNRSGAVSQNQAAITDAAKVIAETNTAIGSVDEATGREFVEQVVRVQKVSEGAAADQLRQLAIGNVAGQDVIDAFSSSNLEQLVSEAQIGNVVVPYVVADDISVVEGDDGTQYAVVNVGITAPSNLPVSVHYSTSDATASSGEDYQAVAGTLNWDAGETTVRHIQIPIFGDTQSETDERFHIILTDPVNAAILETIAFGNILSDDAAGFSVSDGTVDHALAVQVSTSGIRLFDNGSVAFDGTLSGDHEFQINAVAGATTDLIATIQPEAAAPTGGLRFIGNGPDSSLTIDPEFASSIEQFITSNGIGRFVVDSTTFQYQDVGTIASSVSPSINGIPVDPIGYGESLTLVGTAPESFDPTIITTAGWTLTRDGEEIDSALGNSLTLTGDQVGLYHATFTATQEGRLPAVATYEFAIVNAPPVAVNDVVMADEDTVLAKSANDGLLANDQDEQLANLRVTSIDGTGITASRQYEFASADFDTSIPYLATGLNDGNFYGVRFEVTEPIDVDRIGGNFQFFTGTGPFGAIVQLDGEFDLPDSVDLSTPDVLATTIVPLAFQDDGDKRGDLDIVLQPGWYALMFGTGKFGSTGLTNLMLNNVPQTEAAAYLHARQNTTPPEYFSVTPSNSVSNARFVLEGTTAGGEKIIALASGATVTAESDGSFTYDPTGSFDELAPGESAQDSFTYTVADTGGLTSEATAFITIDGINDAPVAMDDAYSVSEQSLARPATSIGIFANDTDVDNPRFSLTQINGQAVTLSPAYDFASAQVDPALTLTTISVNSTNYYGVRFFVAEPTQVDRLGAGVQYAGGDSVFAAIHSIDGEADYPNSLNLQGLDLVTSTVIPVAPGYVGDVFADVDVVLQPGWYSLVIGTDAFNASGTTNLLLNNAPVGDPSVFHVAVGLGEFRPALPEALFQQLRFILEGTAAGDETVIALASGATVTARSNGKLSYDPRAAFDSLPDGQSASDSFTYTIADSGGLSDSATVALTIYGVNDPALISGQTSRNVEEDLDFVQGSLQIFDVDQGEAQFTPVATTSALGTFRLSSDGVWSYDLDNAAVQYLNAGDSLVDLFNVVSLDGTATATMEFTLLGGDDNDTDGVDDAIEDAATHCDIIIVNGMEKYDCNGDEIADSQQDNVASLPNSVNGSYVTVAAEVGYTLTNVMSTTLPSFDVDLPADVEFPIGFTEFIAVLPPDTSTADITLFFEDDQPFNAVYKFGYLPGQNPEVDAPSAFEFSFDPTTGLGAEIFPDRIVLHLQDGQLGDLDLVENGLISDPIGLALVPRIGDDHIGVDEDGSVTFNPLTNDVLPGVLSVTSFTQPSHGTATLDEFGSFEYVPHPDANGLDQFSYTLEYENQQSATATVYLTVNPMNDPPTVDIDVNQTNVNVNEGSTATIAGSWDDIDDGDVVGVNTSLGDIIQNDNGTWTWTFDTQDGPTDSQEVTITATDASGVTAQTHFDLVVNNVAPHNVTIASEVSEYVFAVGNPQVFTAQFADASPLDVHGNEQTFWTFTHLDEVGATVVETQRATVTQATGGGVVDDAFSFDEAGVYYVTLTVTDDDGEATESAPSIFVVYDPSAGFVTGGGWLDSPAGADRTNPEATGRANFGFVSKYKKGAKTPSGQTKFQFAAGDLKFESDTYQWLVVAGARAQYKGVGTINGQGNYGFMLTAIDGQINGGGGIDRFRIKIWDRDNQDTIRYDNQAAADDDDNALPSTALGGGQILIHSGGKKQELTHDLALPAVRSTPALDAERLKSAVQSGIKHWIDEGIDRDSLHSLSSIEFVLADLPGGVLGMASDSTNVIWIDVDAAGLGWNVESTFTADSMGRVDLLSTVTHELGHVLGLSHEQMGAHLAPGQRHLPQLPGQSGWTGIPVMPSIEFDHPRDHDREELFLALVDDLIANAPRQVEIAKANEPLASWQSPYDVPMSKRRKRDELIASDYEKAVDQVLGLVLEEGLEFSSSERSS